MHLIKNGEKVIVVSNRKDILDFCIFMNIQWKVLPKITSNDIIQTPKKIKNIVEKVTLELSGEYSVFHITHKSFDIHCLLVPNIHKRGKIVFHKTEWDPELLLKYRYFSSINPIIILREIIKFWIRMKIIVLMNWKLDLTFRVNLGTLIPVLKEKNFNKFSIQIVEYNNRHNFYAKVYDKFKISVEDSYNLFIVSDIDEMSTQATKESILKVYDVILLTDVHVKNHPNRNNNKLYAKQYQTFIPAELLVNHVKNSVVGLISGVFRYSLTKSDIRTISCINLLDWHSTRYKRYWTDYLNEMGTGIIFPKTLTELYKLLKR
ncbi:MAG TPA: hypothetical protein PLZ15_10800 [Melioribacteraceae bacterium]|nr:hypothetical protein [Melioribacteraceae bacterium]